MKRSFSSLYNQDGFYYPWVLAFCSLFLMLFSAALHVHQQHMELNQSLKTSYQLQQYYQSAHTSWSPVIKSRENFPLTIRRSFEEGTSAVTCQKVMSTAVCDYTVEYKGLSKSHRLTYELSVQEP
ncbi:hypothetical protein [Salimicrobium halophilum]|uniref:Uncharacterized protein n=1 Tax=Salimicrobium halophilum TaxID=86666 RepID=A0A1G8PSY4_9BACI|nr:hypothetical protein [Salimicrobium halophilum]SDI95597.1 hypothetical protein SAMN04490247_0181 [Salimicrobium halophilum]